MKFSELLGDDQPTEVPPGSNGRPPDVPPLVDEAAAASLPVASVEPAPVEPAFAAPFDDAFDAGLDSQLDALPGPESAFTDVVATEPTPIRFGEPAAPTEPEPYPPLEPAAYEPPAYEPPALEPEAEAPGFETPAYDPPAFEPVAELAPEPPAFEAPALETPVFETPAAEPEPAPVVDAFTPVTRPTATSVFGGGRVEAQSSGLLPLDGADPAEPEPDDDAMRIARLDVIDDDILPTTRKRSKK